MRNVSHKIVEEVKTHILRSTTFSPEKKCRLYNNVVDITGHRRQYNMAQALYMINLLTPNVNYSGRTAQLNSKVAFYIFIQQI